MTSDIQAQLRKRALLKRLPDTILISGNAGAGKTTLETELILLLNKLVPTASFQISLPLASLALNCFDIFLSEEFDSSGLDFTTPEVKAISLPNNTTVRDLLVDLGVLVRKHFTVRNLISAGFLLNDAIDADILICSQIRSEAELDILMETSAKPCIVHITRPGVAPLPSDFNPGFVPDPNNYHRVHTLVNDGTPQDLVNKFFAAININLTELFS